MPLGQPGSKVVANGPLGWSPGKFTLWMGSWTTLTIAEEIHLPGH
jgi:hypothetical protein